MTLPFLIGLLVYIAAVFLSYSEKMKASHWYFPVGILIAIVANVMWLYIAKNSPAKESIYVRGLIWDSMIVGTYTLIPIVFFGVRLSSWTLAGAALIAVGLILTKVG